MTPTSTVTVVGWSEVVGFGMYLEEESGGTSDKCAWGVEGDKQMITLYGKLL